MQSSPHRAKVTDILVAEALRRATIPALLSATLLILILFPTVSGTFFLYDDFAIVGITPGLGLREVFTSGTGGFFRPIAVLLFGVEARLFGWSHPEGYAAVSLILHVLNASLLGLLLHWLGTEREEAAAGFVLFLASPWAGEAIFWKSAQFDLLATTGILGTTLFGLAALETAGVRRALLFAAILACGAIALLSKESVVPLPLFFLLLIATRHSPRTAARTLLIAASALVLVVAGYLILRNDALPGLKGPYGSFGDLILASHPLENGARFVSAFARLPMPREPWLGTASMFLLAFFWVLVLGRALARDARRAALLLLGFATALAPIIFLRLEPGSTAGGRLLYLPGVFAVLLFTLAWRRSPQATAVLVLFVALALPSLFFQRYLWSAAEDLSRKALARFDKALPATSPLWIPDLPARFEEGPYVLKGYAFRYYFGRRLTVPVRADGIILVWRDGQPVAIHSEPDPFSAPAHQGETTLRLGLVPYGTK